MDADKRTAQIVGQALQQISEMVRPGSYRYYKCTGQMFNTCTNFLKRKEGSHHCKNCNEPLSKENVLSLDSTEQFTTTNAQYVAENQTMRQGFCEGSTERHIPKVKWREWCSPNCRKRALRRGLKADKVMSKKLRNLDDDLL